MTESGLKLLRVATWLVLVAFAAVLAAYIFGITVSVMHLNLKFADEFASAALLVALVTGVPGLVCTLVSIFL